MTTVDGALFTQMIRSGAANLRVHAKEINDLNVFPIPDGDTGDNMLMTMMGGVHHDELSCNALGESAERVSRGMLLSARGNSGVILSQFFEGIKKGFSGLDSANAKQLGEAFRQGVRQAYGSVMTPTEGTILTVVREATEYACEQNTDTAEGFLNAFADEAKRSLKRTPELLPVLKKAGVVDSGGAGLIYIIDGMIMALLGKDITANADVIQANEEEFDPDAFDEDSVLEFGYCTELLIRLQNAKTDVSSFDEKVITDYLQTVGDSIVTVRNGSIIKLHVHTMTPHKVLEFCQKYGEFLKVKIENMTVQHNNTTTEEIKQTSVRERKGFGVVAVASGDGLKQTFRERGADVIVDGGQSMNPSTEDFITAFDEVNADVIFVFPNNANVILAAKQACRIYESSDVRVIESSNVGEGYAALSMFDFSHGDVDATVDGLTMAMDGVICAEVSQSVRDAVIDNTRIGSGDYIGFAGKELLAVSADRYESACRTIESIGMSEHEVCIIVFGKNATFEEAERIEDHIHSLGAGKEVYIIDGGQDVYDYILIIE